MLSPSTDELTMGHLRRPWTAARQKNGVKVSLLPVACSNFDFIFSRRLNDAGHVDFENAMYVRAGALRHEHVLGDLLAHVRHGHEFAGGDAADGLQRRGDGGAAGAS